MSAPKNFLFLCGSLEPGHDGVGDYTRCLAAELICQGYNARIVSLRDKVVSERREERQECNGQAVPVLRLPIHWSWAECMQELGGYAEGMEADVLSLQYVPFSFHEKGLCFGLGKRLHALRPRAQWHLMFHELWCGMGTHASIKHRILGFLQRRALLETHGKLKPVLVHTSTDSYQSHLASVGIRAAVLPLFGNIPRKASRDAGLWSSLLTKVGCEALVAERTQWIVGGIFGTLYHNPGLETLLSLFAEAASDAGKKAAIFLIGNQRNAELINQLKRALPSITWISTGFLSPEAADAFLIETELGIITTPAEGIGKSGAAAAWLERGVPVIIPGSDTSYQSSQAQEGIIQVLSKQELHRALALRNTLPRISRLTVCAEMLLSGLATA